MNAAGAFAAHSEASKTQMLHAAVEQLCGSSGCRVLGCPCPASSARAAVGQHCGSLVWQAELLITCLSARQEHLELPSALVSARLVLFQGDFRGIFKDLTATALSLGSITNIPAAGSCCQQCLQPWGCSGRLCWGGGYRKTLL